MFKPLTYFQVQEMTDGLNTRFGQTNISFYNEHFGSFAEYHPFEFPQGGDYTFTVTVTKPKPMTATKNVTIDCIR